MRDASGAVIQGVTVTMTKVDTDVAQETATDERGLYLFPLVPAGTYRVEASAAGFTTTVVQDVRVALNAPTSVDIVVEVGEVTETVVVAAAGPQSLLNTANAELNTNLSREQVRDLPLNGRDVTQLALTQAGVTGRPARAPRPSTAREGPSIISRWTGSTIRTRSFGRTPCSVRYPSRRASSRKSA